MSSLNSNQPGSIARSTPPNAGAHGPAPDLDRTLPGRVPRTRAGELPRRPVSRTARSAPPAQRGGVVGPLLQASAVVVLAALSIAALWYIDGSRSPHGAATTSTVPGGGPAPTAAAPSTVPAPPAHGAEPDGRGSSIAPATLPTGAGGRPVLHQPDCRVTVNVVAASRTPQRIAAVDAALATLASVGGFHFVTVDRRADISIEWGDIDEPFVLGRTAVRFVDGEIDHAAVRIEPSLGDSEGRVVLHELLHALGAGHSDDMADVMYPSLVPDALEGLSAGDVRVTEHLGRLAECGS